MKKFFFDEKTNSNENVEEVEMFQIFYDQVVFQKVFFRSILFVGLYFLWKKSKILWNKTVSVGGWTQTDELDRMQCVSYHIRDRHAADGVEFSEKKKKKNIIKKI